MTMVIKIINSIYHTISSYSFDHYFVQTHSSFGIGGFGMDDSRGQSGSYDSGYTWEQNERSYEDIFRGVQADADIISEAWKLYSDDLKEEIADVYEVSTDYLHTLEHLSFTF